MFARALIVAAAVAVAWVVLVRPSSGGGTARTYVVRPADTLWSIAASHYHGDPRAAVWKLQQQNGLRTSTLRPGEELVLPP